MAFETETRRCCSCQDALALFFKDRVSICRGDFELPYNFTTLEKSAIGGCDLCRILYQSLVYAEPPAVDLQDSTELVRLSSDSISLTIQLRCNSGGGHEYLVSNVLWSMRPDLRPIGGNEFVAWSPSARMKTNSKFHLQEANFNVGYDESRLLQDIDYVCPQIRQWFHECKCTSTFPKRHSNIHNLPTRLIDVGPADGSVPPRLRIIKGYSLGDLLASSHHESRFPPWSYLSLSYCWGKQHASVGTTKENLQDRTQSIPVDSLPKTIRDAIAITRRMGVRFLWADVLCIIQLDNTDWVQECKRMGDYYEGSLFTIAAASASDSAEGCLFSRRGLRFPQHSCLLPTLTYPQYLFPGAKQKSLLKGAKQPFPPAANRQFHIPYSKVEGADLEKHLAPTAILTATFTALGSIGMKRTSADPTAKDRLIKFDRVNPCLPSAHHVVDQSPLFTRGWVLQELLLSTRVVFWTRDVLYWNCREKFVSEHGHDCNRFGAYVSKWSRDIQLMKNQPCWDRESALVRWTSVIQRFSSMSLSVPQDTLPAISAIAKSIQAMYPDDYLAGHWRQSLVDSLAWVSMEKGGSLTGEAGHHWEPANYVAPSWSWASVSTFRRISLRFIRREFRRDVELIAATTQLASSDPMGMVSAGSISLLGTMTEMAFCSEQFPDDLDVHYWREPNGRAEIFLDVPVDPRLGMVCFLLGHLDLETDGYEAWDRKSYTGILFLVLLLEPTHQVTDQYRRIGVGVLSRDRWFGSQGLKTTIEII